uniref:Uncharacterized protein n=1 Tax=Rhizophora mucronata TaxID=61149 RepID=A0A2P2PZZ8_RHIMU
MICLKPNLHFKPCVELTWWSRKFYKSGDGICSLVNVWFAVLWIDLRLMVL